MNGANRIACFAAGRLSYPLLSLARYTDPAGDPGRLATALRRLFVILAALAPGLLLLVPPATNAAIQMSTAPVEVLRVAPPELRAGTEVQLVIGVYRSDINPLRDPIAVSFGRYRVSASGVETTRAGFVVTAQVPQKLDPTGFDSITVTVGKASSDPFRDFRFTVAELEIAEISPHFAKVGDTVVLRLSRSLTDAERKSLTVNFQKVDIVPTEVAESEIKMTVPAVESPTPAITITADNVTSRPYLDFTVEGLTGPVGVPTSADNSQVVKGILSVAGFLIAILTIIVAVIRRRRREAEIASQLTKYQFELETGQSGDLTLDKPVHERIPDPPPELVAACASSNCVLFAGSGLGAQAGFPTWQGILNQIVHTAQDTSPPPEDTDWKTVAMLVRGNDVNTAARLIRGTLSNDVIFRALCEAYDDTSKDDSAIHKTLARLPFQSAIRLGFDNVVERAYLSEQPILCAPQTPTSISELDHNDRTSFVIYKLSGTIRQPESPILTASELREAIKENQPLARFMQGKFMSQPFLFVGVSAEMIEQFLSVFGITSRGNVEHCALVYREEGIEAATAALRDFGINVLIYDATPEFPEFGEFMRRLADAVETSGIQQRPRSKPSPVLNKITLENVGPFDHLQIDLTESWNILLGDNGCGKTTILKAVSSALCGDREPAKAAISRLLKSKRDDGKIVLQVGDREYTTTIRREGKRITVRSRQVTPLEAGSMLVLGFPALRGASTVAAKAPDDDEQYSTPDVDISDVLPLVSGAIDVRMDSLSQWVIDTESRGRDDERYARLLHHFFELMDKLTPGVKLDFGEIDKTNWRVLVDTEDGRIPIDLVSQGMSSIYSWAGCLLQRLQEVYPDSDDLTKERALVLVDELDAHMHPKWQQLIIQNLKDTFPNIQFIATTHSPLIIGGMPVEQVIRLDRDESGKVVRVDVPADMTMGRTDQILAGSLFDLETTLDVETQRITEQYHDLLAKEKRTPDEERSMVKLREQLSERIPVSPTEPAHRRALQMFRSIVDSQLGDSMEEMQDVLIKQAEELLETVGQRKRKQH